MTGGARLDPPNPRRVDRFYSHHVYGHDDVGINKWPARLAMGQLNNHHAQCVYTVYVYSSSIYDTCMVTWTSPWHSLSLPLFAFFFFTTTPSVCSLFVHFVKAKLLSLGFLERESRERVGMQRGRVASVDCLFWNFNFLSGARVCC